MYVLLRYRGNGNGRRMLLCLILDTLVTTTCFAGWSLLWFLDRFQPVTEQENTMTEQVYEDDEKMRSILDVLKAAELFGEVISVRNLVSSDELDTEDTEEDDWADIQTKYGHDTADYVFGDVVIGGIDGWTVTPIASTISLDIEPVSGHDWISPVTNTGRKIYVVTGVQASCGLKEADCFESSCKHVPVLEEEDEIRYEFKQDWNSMADRPTENFFMGLPGLRYIENDQTYFTRINTVCSSCYLYTPSRLETCQNCDRVLVAV